MRFRKIRPEQQRIIVVILISVLIHAAILFGSFPLQDPVHLEPVSPAFPMIDAVVLEAPTVRFVPPPPPPPPPEVKPVVQEELNEAVTPDPEAPEEDEPVEEPVTPPVPETLISSDAAPSPEPAAPKPATVFVPFYRVEKKPEYIVKADIEYPAQARRLKIEGTVIIDADIDAEGTIIAVKVVRSAGFGFDEAAEAMLRASRFSPAIMDSRPVAVRMRFTIEFTL